MDKDFIIQYLAGGLTSIEEAQILDWVLSSEENKEEFAQIKNAWALSSFSQLDDSKHVDIQYDNLLNKIKGSQSIPITIQPPFYRRLNIGLLAASFILTVALSSLLGYYFAVNHLETNTMLSVSNGKQTSIVLADGTTVWLNSASTLQYPTSFKGETREVTLQGEAYFDVTHIDDKPFIVHTTDVNVKVYGTSFNLSNYSDDEEAKLILEKGSVSIVKPLDGKELVRLVPGEMATFSKKDQQVNLTKVETSLYSSWHQGQFKFKKMSFEDIAKKLGRQYNVTFIFKNKNLQTTTYNGSFYKYEPLESVLKLMQKNSPFVYSMQRDTVFIK